ncbi:MAG TPA: hypothetical protein VGI50_07585, partial [Solirubrobacteraceae bacterium]
GVEFDATAAYPSRFNLDPSEPPLRRQNGSKVEWEPTSERKKHVYSGRDEPMKDGCLGRVPSVNRVHVRKIMLGSDRTHVRASWR